ncbi:hypothetical protein GEMRC1_012842 [Eukaryota sp. GEM-RC1]
MQSNHQFFSNHINFFEMPQNPKSQPQPQTRKDPPLNPRMVIHHDSAVSSGKPEWEYTMRVPDLVPEEELPSEEDMEPASLGYTEGPPQPIIGESEPIKTAKRRHEPVYTPEPE